MYVRVHGHLKGFQGKRHLNAFSVRYKLIYLIFQILIGVDCFEIGYFLCS